MFTDSKPDNFTLKGAEFVEREGKRLIAIRAKQALIGFPKEAGETRQMSLMLRLPENVRSGKQYQLHVRQRNMKQQVVGGALLIIKVKANAQ